MQKWWERIFLLAIIAIAAGAVYAIWPDEPERYLPDAIAEKLPSGKGLPSSILGVGLPCKSDETNTNPAADCKGMTLGLDLQGGSRIKLKADVSGLNVSDEDIDDGLNAAKDIVDSRINPFGVSESSVQRSGKDELIVELPGVSAQTARDITRPAVLTFCEPLQQGDQLLATGAPIAVVTTGRVVYKPGTCDPDLDANGQVNVRGADGTVTRQTPTFTTLENVGSLEAIIWTPAKGDLNGAPTTMTGAFLRSNAFIDFDSLGQPLLRFSMTDDGKKVFGSLSQRLIGSPLSTFLDGEPIRGEDGQVLAPTINAQITDSGVTTGLSVGDARRLKTFLNNGAFPIPLKVVQQQDVDASLGDEAVLHSVEAGIVALLLIMGYMILYYRLPGLLAATALGVYTAVVLALFKIGIPGSGPVTLTLAGIAAFVLSVGMAVDANILIFERMKEELRNGRSLIPSVEAGFHRAWSSIRDSNVSTLITCGILYWMGDRFGSSIIKGFSLTLAIGVVVSMFSAILVSRTFLRLAMNTPLARPLWLWTDDKPDLETPMSTRGVTGVEAADA
ncbi:MAG: protein translocase subunit SecD [Chloroflexi bacterium]|nr:protein translocase subunit SecD [Chloroflexota bacterium]